MTFNIKTCELHLICGVLANALVPSYYKLHSNYGFETRKGKFQHI